MVSKKSVHQTTLVGRDDFRCVVFISCPSGLLSTCQLSWPSDPKLVESLWAWNNSFILLRLETWSPLLVCMAWNGSFILLVDPKIKGRRLGVLYLYVWLGMVALYYQWTQKLKVGDLGVLYLYVWLGDLEARPRYHCQCQTANETWTE